MDRYTEFQAAKQNVFLNTFILENVKKGSLENQKLNLKVYLWKKSYTKCCSKTTIIIINFFILNIKSLV